MDRRISHLFPLAPQASGPLPGPSSAAKASDSWFSWLDGSRTDSNQKSQSWQAGRKYNCHFLRQMGFFIFYLFLSCWSVICSSVSLGLGYREVPFQCFSEVVTIRRLYFKFRWRSEQSMMLRQIQKVHQSWIRSLDTEDPIRINLKSTYWLFIKASSRIQKI